MTRTFAALATSCIFLTAGCSKPQPEPPHDCAGVARAVDACAARLGAPPQPDVLATCQITTCTDKQAAIDCVIAATCDGNYLARVAACQSAQGCFASTCPALPDAPPSSYGNPPGYTVHTLDAPGLCSNEAAINGVSVDTSSPTAIDASIQAMLISTHAPTTVEEAPGAAADLTVDFTTSTPLPPHFYAADLQWWSKYFLTLETYRALVRNIRIDMLRFPGGQERFEYLRDVATQPPSHDELGKDQPYQYILTSEDVANYIQLCRDLGIEPELEFNLYNVAGDTLGQHQDAPSMWADMVDQVVNELGYDLRYMSAGNEPEVNVFDNWTYFTNPDGTSVTSVPEAIQSYMRRFVQWRAATESVHPGMTYALAETGDWSNLDTNLDLFLDNLQGVDPGALSFHWYPMGEWTGQPPTDPAYPTLTHMVVNGNQGHSISALKNLVATARQKLADHGLGGDQIFIGEWSVAWSATPATAQIQDKMATVVFNAEVMEFTKTLGLDSSQYFSLSDPTSFTNWNPALITVDDQSRVAVRPQYYLYVMYKYLYGDRIVPVPEGQSDDWSIYAALSTSGADHLMLINRTADQTITKVVTAKVASGTRTLRLTLYPHSVAIVSF
jgi:hypothetical protein